METGSFPESERLLIGRFVPGDAERLLRYRAEPAVARFQGWIPRDVEDAREFLRRNESAEFGSTEGWVQLAVRRRADGVLIGDVGLRSMGEHRDQAEIGFTIAPEHQRRGYASEAVAGVLGTLFGDFKVHRVMASVDPRNGASMALLPKLGFRKEAHHRRSLWFKGEWVDDVIFALLAEEWRAGRGRQGPSTSHTIRPATEGDIPGMQRVRGAVLENRLTTTVLTAENYREAIAERGRGWVAVEGERVVGFAVGFRGDGNLWALFVDPQNEQQGLGRRLLDAVVEWLRREGVQRMWLRTDPGTRAEGFYRAAGWKACGTNAEGELRFEFPIGD